MRTDHNALENKTLTSSVCKNCTKITNHSTYAASIMYYDVRTNGNTSSEGVVTSTIDATAVRVAVNITQESDHFLVAVHHIHTIIIPILCFIGLLGNATAVGIFRGRTLKKKSCCMYLTTKCLVDTIFLAALFVVWLLKLDIHWFHYHGVCQMIIFTTYVSGFLSVWLVVMATGENYARICHPHKVHYLCTPGKARAVLLSLTVVSIFCYHFPLWTVHSVTSPITNSSRCADIPEYARFNHGLTYFDTAVTLVVPLILVIGFMCGIFTALMAAHQRNKRMKKLGRIGRQRNTKFLCLTPYGQVTAMLLAVSAIFVLLHTPSHAIRIHLLLSRVVNPRYKPTLTLMSLKGLLELLYYSNFSTNLFTYLIFGKAFRKLYVRAYCPCATKDKRNKTANQNGGLQLPVNTLTAPLDEGDDVMLTDIGVISSEMIAMKVGPLEAS